MDDPAELIRRWCRTGDEAAFHDFYASQAERLWRFLVARGNDEETAYDVVADAFERFVRRVCRDPRSPVAFLYRIAINRATDLARRRAVREPAPPADPDAQGGSPSATEAQAELDQLLRGLESGEQDLLLLRYWVGLTHREAAAVLELPEGTVRRRSAALVDRLRRDGNGGWRAEENELRAPRRRRPSAGLAGPDRAKASRRSSCSLPGRQAARRRPSAAAAGGPGAGLGGCRGRRLACPGAYWGWQTERPGGPGPEAPHGAPGVQSDGAADSGEEPTHGGGAAGEGGAGRRRRRRRR
ncbi:MAG: sigma-70 family RNA polymerase sigma factor [Halofilum sp. (in: g-proteobacteria)]|nr:sigma-70 family RNA polymerase sigma factor [Halofilum sp. (in: g-proteobacteria)]